MGDSSSPISRARHASSHHQDFADVTSQRFNSSDLRRNSSPPRQHIPHLSEVRFANAEAFEAWNNVLTNEYVNSHVGSICKAQYLRYPLFRQTTQDRSTVFREGGSLKNRNMLSESMNYDALNRFDLVNHQIGGQSSYISTTTDLSVATNFSNSEADSDLKKWIYVIDPQPHARYLNGEHFTKSPSMNSQASKEDKNNYENGKSVLRDEFLTENEFLIPDGVIPSADIRAAIPIVSKPNKLDYSSAIINTEYNCSECYKKTYDEAWRIYSKGLGWQGGCQLGSYKGPQRLEPTLMRCMNSKPRRKAPAPPKPNNPNPKD